MDATQFVNQKAETYWTYRNYLQENLISGLSDEETCIQMSANIASREPPVLVVFGPDGKGEVVNYRMKDQTYIVDRLFEHAQLVLGSGKKAQKVEISHDHRE